MIMTPPWFNKAFSGISNTNLWRTEINTESLLSPTELLRTLVNMLSLLTADTVSMLRCLRAALQALVWVTWNSVKKKKKNVLSVYFPSYISSHRGSFCVMLNRGCEGSRWCHKKKASEVRDTCVSTY